MVDNQYLILRLLTEPVLYHSPNLLWDPQLDQITMDTFFAIMGTVTLRPFLVLVIPHPQRYLDCIFGVLNGYDIKSINNHLN